ncbi:MAG: hypothetical protein OHK0013_28510 [Sandaracinaceae bacterium]
MSWIIGLFWAVVGAAVVAWLLGKQQEEDLRAVDRGEDVDCTRVMEPGSAFVLCTAFLIVAPIVLARARGARGALEGLAILLGGFVLSTVSVVALVLLRH